MPSWPVPRSGLASLERVFRASRAGDGLLAQFIVDHLEDVADALGVDRVRLSILDVERVEGRGRLRAAIDRARNQRAATHLVEAERRRAVRASALIQGARWAGGTVELPLAELFAFASSAMTPVVDFETPSFVVHVPRPLLVRARAAVARLPSPSSHLDPDGLHLRWRDGRGGLDLRCPPPAPRDEPAFVVRFEPRVARPPVLLGQVLHDLGLTA